MGNSLHTPLLTVAMCPIKWRCTCIALSSVTGIAVSSIGFLTQQQLREHRGSDQYLCLTVQPLSALSAQNKAQVWARHMTHCASCSTHHKTRSEWLDPCPEMAYPAHGPCTRPHGPRVPGTVPAWLQEIMARSQWPVLGPSLGLVFKRPLTLFERKTDHKLIMIMTFVTCSILPWGCFDAMLVLILLWVYRDMLCLSKGLYINIYYCGEANNARIWTRRGAPASPRPQGEVTTFFPSIEFKAQGLSLSPAIDARDLQKYLVLFYYEETKTLRRKIECLVVTQYVVDRIESPKSVQSWWLSSNWY